MNRTKLIAMACLGVAAIGAAALVPVRASSHREAPLISQDPLADNTDLYAFVSPTTPDKVTIIANFIPLEAPYGGPNFYKFDDNVTYAIKIDNNGDAREDITYQFRFKTSVANGNTFLYNTGPITSLDSANWNVRQSYTVTRVLGSNGLGGRTTVLGKDLTTPPVNIGFRSTPNYEALAAAAVQDLGDGVRVFAGQRDDPFFVDLNVFDLLAVPPADTNNSDSLAGYNVHTIAIEVAIASLTANGQRPSSMSDPNAVIGIWSTASRPNVTTQMNAKSVGAYVQVSRLGQPLVNEVVIPRAAKDIFNSIQPTDDAAA